MKKTINVLFAFTFALSCFFTSCANLEDSFTSENGDNGRNPTYSISGTVTGLGFEGQEPRDNSRTAMSNLSDIVETNIKYTVTAQKGDLVVTKEGSPFTLALPSAGEWTVSATGVDRTNQSTVLSTDSKVIFISPVSPTGYVNLEARPVITDDGFGKIDLSFGTLPGKVSRVSVVCNDANWQADNLVVNTSGIKTSGDVKSGSYTVDINFYDSSDVLCYNCTQTINVFNGFTTNTWIKHGSESYLEYKTAGNQKPGSAADFKLTDALLDQYVLRTIYVDTSFTDTSTGTWLAPYKSLDDARDFVSSKLSELGEITLMLRGTEKTVEGTTVYELESTFYGIGNEPLFKIEEGKKLTVKSWDITKPATIINKTGQYGFFNSSGTLVIENIILDGTSTYSWIDCGAIKNTGNSVIDLNNVTIKNFTLTTYSGGYDGSGAALHISTGGTATLNKVTITNCNANVDMGVYGRGGAVFVGGGTVTLTDSTIEKCSAKMGGAISVDQSNTSKLTLSSVTITDCTAENSGGGIYYSKGTFNILGKTVIENNKLSNGKFNNIELASSSNISISGTGAESRIGITKDFDVVGENTVQFASDTTADISEKYFSDAGYTIGNISGKGCIARTTGVLSAGYYEDVKFAADETEFFVGEGTSTITFSAKVGAGTDPVAIDNWNATVTYAGIDITNRVEKTAAEDKKSYKIDLPSTFPEGNYFIAVRGDYNGVSYSGTEIISISDPDFRNLSAENIASVNMERYAGREMRFIIDSTVSIDQLKALTAKINTSSAKVTLDLSSANLSSMTSSGIVQRNVVKIVLPNNLSSISGSYSLFAYGSYISDVEEFEISSSNTKYCVEDGILYNAAKTEVVCYPPAKKDESFTTADSVTSIGKYGIAYNRYLKTLVLSKVTTINDYACYKNTKLESCELYKGTFNGTEWTGGPGVLNQYAFSGCSALRTITIPATVWRFVGNCFTYCTSLESVTFLRTVGPSFYLSYSECNEFEGCTNLKHIYVPRGATAGYTTPLCAQYNTYWAGDGGKHWNSLSQSGKLFEPGFVVEVD